MVSTSAQVPGLVAFKNRGWLKVVPFLREVYAEGFHSERLRYDVFVRRRGGLFRLYMWYWARLGKSLRVDEIEPLVSQLQELHSKFGLEVEE